MEALSADADLPTIFDRMLAILDAMQARNPSWGPLFVRHPGDLAPEFQPNGESSAALARKYIEECMARGSARFEWVASAPDGEEIPLVARIVCCCDAFHAMTSDRAYRKALTSAVALAELEANSGTQFDPEVVAALTGVVRG